MRKIKTISCSYLFLFLSIILNAQSVAVKKTPASAESKKYGGYTVTSVEKDPRLAADISKVYITFIGANNKPVKQGVKIIFNNDSLVPELNASGIFSSELEPGKHDFQFAAPYWYRVKTIPINFKPQHTINIKVKFEAQDFSAH